MECQVVIDNTFKDSIWYDYIYGAINAVNDALPGL